MEFDHFDQNAGIENGNRPSIINSGGSRISQRGRQPQRGANLLFVVLFSRKCMKMKKKIGLRRGTRDVPLRNLTFSHVFVESGLLSVDLCDSNFFLRKNNNCALCQEAISFYGCRLDFGFCCMMHIFSV